MTREAKKPDRSLTYVNIWMKFLIEEKLERERREKKMDTKYAF